MNREETIKAIAVMQAFVDGKEIVYVGSGTVWMDPGWNWWGKTSTYKVKPREPAVCYRNEYPKGDVNDVGDGFGQSYTFEANCIFNARASVLRKAVKFVEMMEEQTFHSP